MGFWSIVGMANENNSGAFVGGVIIGATIGVVAGVLAAPRSGKETRQFLRKSADALPELAEDLSTSIQLQADRLSEKALRNWEQTLERLREAIAAGQDASQRELEPLRQQDPALSSPPNRE